MKNPTPHKSITNASMAKSTVPATRPQMDIKMACCVGSKFSIVKLVVQGCQWSVLRYGPDAMLKNAGDDARFRYALNHVSSGCESLVQVLRFISGTLRVIVLRNASGGLLSSDHAGGLST